MPGAIFTHRGSRIVSGDESTLGTEVRQFAEERDVEAEIPRDGMDLILR